MMLNDSCVMTLSDGELVRNVENMSQGAKGFWCLLTNDHRAAVRLRGRLCSLGIVAVVENTICMDSAGKQFGVFVSGLKNWVLDYTRDIGESYGQRERPLVAGGRV